MSPYLYHNPRTPPDRPDERLISGPYSRIKEFLQVLRVGWEFIKGFRTFHFIGPAVTVFGSARFSEDNPYFDQARRLSTEISKLGFTVVTGGGPGIMEAANRGAQEAGGLSVAAGIDLPSEVGANRYLDRYVNFHYFFVRKVILLKYSYAFIIFPGGFGTLDEATEALTLISTKKLVQFPIIFFGKDYWNGFYEWLEESPLQSGAITEEHLRMIHLTDDFDEVLRIVSQTAKDLGVQLQPLKP